MSDNIYENIMTEAYRMLADSCKKSKSIVDAKTDQKSATALLPRLCISLIKIDEDEGVSKAQLQKELLEAKEIYIQLHYIKARNPEVITNIFEVRLEKLRKAMARHEAELIEGIAQTNPCANLVDLRDIFTTKRYYTKLKSKLASVIYIEAIKEAKEALFRSKHIVYVTKSGTRYHTKNCPYCKGKEVIEKDEKNAENMHYSPCKCINEAKNKEYIDKSHVTAFIDESIRPVKWNELGEDGNIGSFSFILCWGKLQSEHEITEINTIAKQVDYSRENTCIEKITESAIGKVMLTLAYDYDFHGDLNIYVDNSSASIQWQNNPVNERLTHLFDNVTVTLVGRELNSMTDDLGRHMVFLCMPKSTYSSIVEKCGNYDNIKKTTLQKDFAS